MSPAAKGAKKEAPKPSGRAAAKSSPFRQRSPVADRGRGAVKGGDKGGDKGGKGGGGKAEDAGKGGSSTLGGARAVGTEEFGTRAALEGLVQAVVGAIPVSAPGVQLQVTILGRRT